MKWYLKALYQYADFTGRAQRMEYWMFHLVNLIIGLLFAALDGVLGLDSNVDLLKIGLLQGLYSLVVLLPSWGVAVRRLHDTGRSGWWLLIAIIPVIGWIVLIVFLATDGDRQPNAYGPDPKAVPRHGAAVA
jgi:uncharacterized membrane protein YhaH (DUF805 family)